MNNHSKINILLVDDVAINHTAGVAFLKLFGITPDIAINGKEAVELVRRKDYDILFMDHIMPGADGAQTTQIIRSLESKYAKSDHPGALKIIALTSDNTAQTQEILFTSGVDDFMAKPLTKDELHNMLLKWLPPEKRQLIENINPPDAKIKASVASNQLNRMLEKSIGILEGRNIEKISAELHALKGAFAVAAYDELLKETKELELLAKSNQSLLLTSKLPDYIDKLSALRMMLDENSTESEPLCKTINSGSPELFAEIVKSLIKTIEQFNRPYAFEQLENALCLTFGERNNRILKQIKADLEDYDYDSAMEKLLTLKEN